MPKSGLAPSPLCPGRARPFSPKSALTNRARANVGACTKPPLSGQSPAIHPKASPPLSGQSPAIRSVMQLPLPLAELGLPTADSILPPPARRIYCNRSLRLDRIAWIGFDMDYTLAVYRQAEMDRISVAATTKRLIARGYPRHLQDMPYRTDFPVRGLLVDKKLGNVLKMDRYKYVKRAYHGMRELSHEERRHLYHSRRLRPGTRRYHWVDTLYALSEVAVYCAAVEELEREGDRVDYERLFGDVRECIDEAHRDGSLLSEISSNLDRYVDRDRNLPATLHKLRSAGKRLFLLTNSGPEYTDAMMRHLLEEADSEYASWRNYFDLVVSASKKPRFFTESAPFHDLDGRVPDRLERGVVYTGGNAAELEAHLAVPGDRVLYVGDHIYGDVLRAKKESAWRTVMIIQEMTQELDALDRCTEALVQADALEELHDTLLNELRGRQLHLKGVERALADAEKEADGHPPPDLAATRVRDRHAIDKMRVRIRAAEEDLERLEAVVNGAFHTFWGSLFKAGPEVSSFGDQVEKYACVYTDRVSNLLSYSPMHYFRSPRDRMPHER